MCFLFQHTTMLKKGTHMTTRTKHSTKLTLATLLLSTVSHHSHADVILHAFNWRYDEVTNKAQEIAELGYKKVLVSPAYKSTGNAWWARYQPQDYRIIDNPLGDSNEFKTMVQALKTQGVETYADIVFNHMANEQWKRSDLFYPGTELLHDYLADFNYINSITLYGDVKKGLFSARDFHGTFDQGGPKCISNYHNVGDVQYNRLCGAAPDAGLPDLSPNNWVISQQKAYLKALKQLGVTGFRVDAAKHMSNDHINAVFDADIKNDLHVFGEIITTGGAGSVDYDNFLLPYLSQTNHSAYDFPLFAQIRSAFSFSGSMSQLVNPQAYGQALAGNKAITFSVTHDIPLNQGFRYQIMDATDEHLANAFILGRDGGVPMIYSDNNESGDNRWRDLYKRNDIQGMLKFHNATHGSSMQLISHNRCVLFFKREHKGVVGINKCDTGQDIWVDTHHDNLWWHRYYRDTLSEDVQKISSQWHKFYLPPRKARMWLME